MEQSKEPTTNLTHLWPELGPTTVRGECNHYYAIPTPQRMEDIDSSHSIISVFKEQQRGQTTCIVHRSSIILQAIITFSACVVNKKPQFVLNFQLCFQISFE